MEKLLQISPKAEKWVGFHLIPYLSNCLQFQEKCFLEPPSGILANYTNIVGGDPLQICLPNTKKRGERNFTAKFIPVRIY